MMFRSPVLRLVIALGLTVTLAACEEEAPETAVEARPVRTITVSTQATGETVSLAGTVESQVQADLGFRISGRVSERLINVGDTVEAGQICAPPKPRWRQQKPSCPKRAPPMTVSCTFTTAASSRAPAMNAPRRP